MSGYGQRLPAYGQLLVGTFVSDSALTVLCTAHSPQLSRVAPTHPDNGLFAHLQRREHNAHTLRQKRAAFVFALLFAMTASLVQVRDLP